MNNRTSTFDVLLVEGPSTVVMDGPPGPITTADHLRSDNFDAVNSSSTLHDKALPYKMAESPTISTINFVVLMLDQFSLSV